MTKKLKAKQEKRVITRESKNKEASIKQIATKELQVEKFYMEEWEQKFISEVGRELQVIKKAYSEAIEVQREVF